MNFASNSGWTSAFDAYVFSSDILHSFCFFGRMDGSVLRLCSMIMQLATTKSRADHANISLLRFKKGNNLFSSALLRSLMIRTV
jgi:hypothetical protein